MENCRAFSGPVGFSPLCSVWNIRKSETFSEFLLYWDNVPKGSHCLPATVGWGSTVFWISACLSSCSGSQLMKISSSGAAFPIGPHLFSVCSRTTEMWPFPPCLTGGLWFLSMLHNTEICFPHSLAVRAQGMLHGFMVDQVLGMLSLKFISPSLRQWCSVPWMGTPAFPHGIFHSLFSSYVLSVFLLSPSWLWRSSHCWRKPLPSVKQLLHIFHLTVQDFCVISRTSYLLLF